MSVECGVLNASTVNTLSTYCSLTFQRRNVSDLYKDSVRTAQ